MSLAWFFDVRELTGISEAVEMYRQRKNDI